jgi:hypothetical protein
MEVVFQIILVFGVVKYCCKAGFFSGYKGIVAYTLFVGIVAIVLFPFIIKMDTNVFDKLLSNKTAVSDIAIIITIETISGILISIGMLNNLFESKMQKWIKVLKLTPGILIIGIIFYIELSLFRVMAGISFAWVAILTAFLSMLGVFGISSGIKYLLPEYSNRYELKFLINILLLVLAVLLHAGLADYNNSNYSANIEYNKLLVFSGIVITGFLFGLFLYRNKSLFKKILKSK